MAVPLKIKNVSNITYSGSDTNDWIVEIREASFNTLMGAYENLTHIYTDGSSLTNDMQVKVVFTFNDINLSEGETITVTHNHGTTTLYLPTYSTSGSTKTWYIDSNGLLYDDIALTILASPSAYYGYTSDSVVMTDESDTDNVFDISETIGIGETSEIEGASYRQESIYPSDSYDDNVLVEYSDVIILTEIISANVVRGIVYRYVDAITISDSTDDDVLVDSILQGVAIGEVFVIDGLTAEDASYITVDKFNMAYAGLKLFESIEVGADKYEGVEVSIMFRYNSDEEWRSTSWIPINKQGIARVGVAGTEFKVSVRSTQGRVVPTYIKIGWKALDKRYVRSAYATSQEG